MRITIVKSGIQIDKILKKGAKVHSNTFVLFYIMGSESGGVEFAAIAGKKVFKHAVDRNFARRRIRELIRATCKDSASPIQIALMAKKPITTAKYADLLTELEEMFSRV